MLDTNLFKIIQKITDQTENNDAKDVEIMVLLKCLKRALEMPLINCKIKLDLNWSENCLIVATNVAAQATTLSITDAKLYLSVVNFINSR